MQYQEIRHAIMNKILLLMSFVVLLAIWTPDTTLAASFPVFDATYYDGKPDLSKEGMAAINLMYAVKFWENKEKRDEPNKQKIITVARNMRTDLLLCIDIEDWPLTGNPDEIKKSIYKYISVASLIKKINPAVKQGFYGIIPIRDFWRAKGSRGEKAFEQWVDENNRLKPIAEQVDVLFPSLYTFSNDQKGWVDYAIANIKEARKYKKPVYVFLWPQYHDSSLLRGRYINADFWRLQLETCRKYADGVVIWGGHGQKWDQNAPWWIETRKFLQNQ